MNITNKVFFNWSVEDPVYPYQATSEFTVDEFKQLNMDEVRVQQEAEYSAWLEGMKAAERGE